MEAKNMVLFYIILICMVNCVMSDETTPVSVEIGTQVNSINTNSIGLFQITFNTNIYNNYYDSNEEVYLKISIRNNTETFAKYAEVFEENITLSNNYTSNVFFNVTPGTYSVKAKLSDNYGTLGVDSTYLLIDNDGNAIIQPPYIYFNQHFPFANISQI